MPGQKITWSYVDIEDTPSIYGIGFVICPSCDKLQEIVQANNGYMIVPHFSRERISLECQGSNRVVDVMS